MELIDTNDAYFTSYERGDSLRSRYSTHNRLSGLAVSTDRAHVPGYVWTLESMVEGKSYFTRHESLPQLSFDITLEIVSGLARVDIQIRQGGVVSEQLEIHNRQLYRTTPDTEGVVARFICPATAQTEARRPRLFQFCVSPPDQNKRIVGRSVRFDPRFVQKVAYIDSENTLHPPRIQRRA